MNAVTLGPFVLATDRAAALIGVAVFLIVGAIFTRRGSCLAKWTTTALLWGFIGARVLHVLNHVDSFLSEPWRILFVWQGGFSWIGGVIGVALTLIFLFRHDRQAIPVAAASLASGAFTWFALMALWQAAEGPPPPRFALSDLAGTRMMSIADRKGRPAVVNLWATWCPPCRREMPLLAEFASVRNDVDFIFANQGEGPSKISAYLQSEKLEITNVLLDPMNSLSRHYSAPGMPVTVFLRPDGSVATTHFGEISREALNAAISISVGR